MKRTLQTLVLLVMTGLCIAPVGAKKKIRSLPKLTPKLIERQIDSMVVAMDFTIYNPYYTSGDHYVPYLEISQRENNTFGQSFTVRYRRNPAHYGSPSISISPTQIRSNRGFNVMDYKLETHEKKKGEWRLVLQYRIGENELRNVVYVNAKTGRASTWTFRGEKPKRVVGDRSLWRKQKIAASHNSCFGYIHLQE